MFAIFARHMSSRTKLPVVTKNAFGCWTIRDKCNNHKTPSGEHFLHVKGWCGLPRQLSGIPPTGPLVWGWCWLRINSLSIFTMYYVLSLPDTCHEALNYQQWQKMLLVTRLLVKGNNHEMAPCWLLFCVKDGCGLPRQLSRFWTTSSSPWRFSQLGILLVSTADTWVGRWRALASLTAVRTTALLPANLPNVSCKERNNLVSLQPICYTNQQKRDKNNFQTGTDTETNWNKNCSETKRNQFLECANLQQPLTFAFLKDYPSPTFQPAF